MQWLQQRHSIAHLVVDAVDSVGVLHGATTLAPTGARCCHGAPCHRRQRRSSAGTGLASEWIGPAADGVGGPCAPVCTRRPQFLCRRFLFSRVSNGAPVPRRKTVPGSGTGSTSHPLRVLLAKVQLAARDAEGAGVTSLCRMHPSSKPTTCSGACTWRKVNLIGR